MVRIAVLDDYQGVAESFGDWHLLPDAETVFFSDHVPEPDQLVTRLRGFDVVSAMRERSPFPREVLAQLPELRLLVTTGMRNAAIDVAAATELGIVVSGTGSHRQSTPELTWALILSVLRNIPQESAAVRAGGWQHTVGGDLAGRTLGILGLGTIGAQVARVGRAFDMQVIAWSQNLTGETCAEVGVGLVSKEDLFRNSDVLSIHLLLSARTRGLVGAAELALMKSDALLVNTSRGPIVDEAALVNALAKGAIAGAGLDVYDVEPLPLAHPYRQLPNVVATPHLGYVTRDSYAIYVGETVESVAAYLAGRPIRVISA